MNSSQQISDINSIEVESLPSPVKNMPFDEFLEIDSGFSSSENLDSSDETKIETCKAKIDKGNGVMDYIKNKILREMLENAWQAINLTETWDFVEQPTYSFTLSNDKRIWIITEKMEELGYYGHSGNSFGCTMRHMHFLATNGVEKFKTLW